jgi:hypothetical protein
MEHGWQRRGLWVLALVALAAAVLRLIPLLGSGGALGYPIEYDEGVYFSAAALFLQGHWWPYRDFVLVQPPGSVWLWGPAVLVGSWQGVDVGFAFARWMAVICGAFSTMLVGRLALRVWGPVAGVVAALVYATYPEAVIVERGPFLEPLLNLACLVGANAWLAEPRSGREEPRWLLAGVFFGLAISVKVLGGIWLFAALLSRPPWPRWRAHVGMVLVAAGTVALLVGPFILHAPSEFFSQVFAFQVMRPPDGEQGQIERMHDLFHERRLVGMALALLGLVLVAVRAFRNAGIWLFAALLSRPPWPRWRAHVGMVLVAAGIVALLVGPFILSPSEFFSQVAFQVTRPHDLLNGPRLVGMALALLGLGLFAVRAFRNAEPTRPAERLLAVAYILTITAFLTAPCYWNQYNAHLAASESILAGIGAAAVYEWLTAWRPQWASAVAGLLCVAVVLPTVQFLRAGLKLKAPEQVALGRYIRQSVPEDETLFAFEPAWGILGGHLPPVIPDAPLVVDSYALMLRMAMATGQEFNQAAEALQSPAAQQAIRELLARSRFEVLGWRGEWQLSKDSKRWFHAHFTRRYPPQGRGGPDVWEQLSQ